MQIRRGLVALLWPAVWLLIVLGGCKGETVPPALPSDDGSAPTQTDQPAPTPVPVPPLAITDNELILAFFPDRTFVKLDETRYSDLTLGDVISIEEVLPGENNCNYVILRKESNFSAVGFITYYAAEIDFNEIKPTSAILVVPDMVPDVDTLEPLPEYQGEYRTFFRQGVFSLLIATRELAVDGTESHRAGLWSLQDGKWNMRWPDMTFPSEGYEQYWQERKAVVGTDSITLYQRKQPDPEAEPSEPDEEPTATPEPSEGESPAPDSTVLNPWLPETTLTIDSLLPE